VASDVSSSPSEASVPDAASLADAAPAPFALKLATSRASVVRGSSTQVDITVVPAGAGVGTVSVTVSGLATGVTADSLAIPAGSTSGTLTLHASATAALTVDAQITLAGASGTATAPAIVLPLTVQDPPGTLDVTFGTNGVAIVPIVELTPNGGLGAQGVALQPDGKIVYCGDAYLAGGYQLVLGRLNVDGSPDTTFNAAGPTPGLVVWLPPGVASLNCGQIAILPSGDMAISGFLKQSGQNHVMFAAEFTSAGLLDSAFGAGTGYVPIWTNDVDSKPGGMFVQSDGKLVLAGFLGPVPAITRLLPTGAADPTFDPAGPPDAGIGFVTFSAYDNVSFGAIAPLPNGDWLAALDEGTTLQAVALSPATGKADPGFGASGVLAAATFTGSVAGLVVESDGSSVFAGSTASTIELARFNPVGQLDTAFGTQGVASAAIAGGNATASSIAATADGRFVVGATLPGSASIGVVRYTSAGALDTTFASAGYAGTPRADGSTTQANTVVAVDGAGRIVVANVVEIPANTHDAGVYGAPAVQMARFWP
jgi:uncharacterized delta-60 repeat protein